MKKPKFELLETMVAGTQHYADSKVLAEINTGDKLILTREPENAYDVNAIRVDMKIEGTKTWARREVHVQKLGYVPRALASLLARLMDHGYWIGAKVDHAHPQKGFIVMVLQMKVRKGEAKPRGDNLERQLRTSAKKYRNAGSKVGPEIDNLFGGKEE